MLESTKSGSTSTSILDVLVIGSGFAGLCIAIKLREANIESFVVLERAHEIGGTWRDNDYPGCACDVQSHLYSFSFAPKPDWTRAFAEQHEIQSYLCDCVQRFGLAPKLRFGAEVVRSTYDEATATWSVETRDGRRWRTRVLVSAMGPLSNPAIPSIEGLDRFEGACFHSADWLRDRDLRGRRVAVIGTGASAIQIVPRIAPKVAHLDLYQRTAPWVVPKPDRKFGRLERAAYARLPALQAARRAAIFWSLEARVLGFTRYPRLMKVFQRYAEHHIRRQIRDPELRAAVTPSYVIGCKRILLANDYYPALARENVELVTSPIRRATARGLIDASGHERPVDTIIYGTGFRVQELVPERAFFGRGGEDLAAVWRECPEAYKGTAVAGFPNLFFLLGPNTGLGHSSMVYIIESQVAYVVDALMKMRRNRWSAVEVRAQAQASFNEELQQRSAGAVWQSGCRSWYLDDAGRNTTLWPDFTFRFRRATAAFDEAAYHVDRLVHDSDDALAPDEPEARPLLAKLA